MSESSGSYNKQVHIFGGATLESDGANPRSGELARRAADIVNNSWTSMDVKLHLTSEADPGSGIDTERDLYESAREVVGNLATKIVVWLPDTPDYMGIGKLFRQESVDGMNPRKDIFMTGMTTTKGASGQDQYNKGLNFVKTASANLALTYDYDSGNAMVVAPEEACYDESSDVDVALKGMLQIAKMRSQLTFTRSTVIGGEPVGWNSDLVYPTLRDVVNYCITNDAYKPFLGVTAGHFAAKIGESEFLTSRRKTNFNQLEDVGLVRVTTDGPDEVWAMGGKPSVGGQSQRIVFSEHPGTDSIVHFHCPIKPGSNVPTVSQREYECGSHECGANTSQGLAVVDDGIEAVYLDNHGPNVVFNHEEDPRKIQEFLRDNFDFSKKTGGYQVGRKMAL